MKPTPRLYINLKLPLNTRKGLFTAFGGRFLKNYDAKIFFPANIRTSYLFCQMGVSKNRGTPKMDGL